jgi:hypothetical protein
MGTEKDPLRVDITLQKPLKLGDIGELAKKICAWVASGHEESYENNIYLKDQHIICSILSEPAIFLVVMMIFTRN